MFGALNRFISRLDADPQVQQQNSTQGLYGFQVLKNTNPDLAIDPWFDFIIGINGRDIESPDPNLFSTEVKNCAGSAVNLGIWSAKGQRTRSIYAPLPTTTASLGLALQWNPLTTTDHVWHILDVTPNSPADLAGLLPYGDYIIGCPDALVQGESGLGELVEDSMNRDLRLHVYNHEYDVTRLVTITPSRSWGGSGALGCVLGFGALHRIPAAMEERVEGPGETMFESARLSTDGGEAVAAAAAAGGGGGGGSQQGQPPPPTSAPQYLVPADMSIPGPLPPPPSSGGASGPATGGHGGRKAKHHGAARGAVDMDAYFQEGEQKSRELEGGGNSPKPSGSLAPPPKGGPPRAKSPLKDDAEEEEKAEE